MSAEAMKLALEALKHHTEQTRPIERTEQAIATLESALAAQGEVNPGYAALLDAVKSIAAAGVSKSYPGHHSGKLHHRCNCCGYRWCPEEENEQHSPHCAAQRARAALAAAPAADPDEALSFSQQDFPLADVGGFKSLSASPLFTTPQPAPQPEPLNLSCKSVQARLAAQWGYAKVEAQEPAAWRYRLAGDLQWQYTERAEVACETMYERQQIYTTPQPAPNPWQALFNDVAKALNCLPSSYPDANGHVLRAAKIAAVRPTDGTPIFWYRPVGTDGGYEGPIHHDAIERVRKESGAWVPLYVAPGPAAPRPAPTLVPMTRAERRLLLDTTGAQFDGLSQDEWAQAVIDAVEQHHADRLKGGV